MSSDNKVIGVADGMLGGEEEEKGSEGERGEGKGRKR
jgi:hypothetical protein